MISKQAALILLTTDFVTGMTEIRKQVNLVQDWGDIEKASSVYKRFLNSRSEDLNSELVLVVKLITDKSLAELFSAMKSLNTLKTNPLSPHPYTLLSYGGTTRLVPGENLPHPLLHSDSLTLRCAAEAWGEYEHPVLGQTLNELVKSDRSFSNVEFYSQFSVQI